MAHFAQLNENNIVMQVIVVHNNELLDENEQENEQRGIEFLINWSNGHINWKQTSYNGTFRKNYAGIGYTYDEERDAFISPKPFYSWILNEDTCQWESPTPYPTDGKKYFWNEDNINWQQTVE